MWRDVFDRNPYGTNCWLLAADTPGGHRRHARGLALPALAPAGRAG